MNDHVKIFDTTLRDGEQAPGATMSHGEKVQLARLLHQLGVDVIEASFPISNGSDFKAVMEISEVCRSSVVCGLARAREKDIQAVADATAKARNNRIHTFISTSPIHMKHKLKMTPEAVLEAVKDSIGFARNLCGDVEWSAEDASRTELDFLCQCVEAAITAGATTINLPDTVGYATPTEYAQMFTDVMERVPNADKAIFSVHCHDDLGMAVANSLAGVQAGARQVECTLNGIGERAGNAALEEIVMALKTRADVFGCDSHIKTENLCKVSRAVSKASGFPVPPNKAIVGANAFAHESGIHQDGMLKHRDTYEIMTPQSVGFAMTNLTLGKLSGKHSFSTKLQELGFELTDAQLTDAFERFKDLATKKKRIYDEDLMALVSDVNFDETPPLFTLSRLVMMWDSDGTQQVTATVQTPEGDVTAHGSGDGPINAAINAIKEATGMEDATLTHFETGALTAGSDAQAGVTVRVTVGDSNFTGKSHDTNTLQATAKAYINALNRARMVGDVLKQTSFA